MWYLVVTILFHSGSSMTGQGVPVQTLPDKQTCIAWAEEVVRNYEVRSPIFGGTYRIAAHCVPRVEHKRVLP